MNAVEEPKLLPEASTPAAKPNDDAADFLRQQRSKPKRVYDDALKTEPQPKAEPKAEGQPTGTGEGPKAEGTGASGEATDGKESAKEFIEAYNTMQAGGFALLAGDLEAFNKFLLPTDIKARAAHHLAKGLGKMGNPEVPWWAGLLIALSLPTALNYFTAMEMRKAKAEGKTRPTAQPHAPRTAPRAGGPPPPPAPAVTVLDRDGKQISTIRPRTPGGGPKPPCAQCGQPVRRTGRKYCSQRCAGLAVSAKRRNASDPPASPAATSTPINEH